MKKISIICFWLFIILFNTFIVKSQKYTIQQYLSIKGAGSPAYSFDDNRIYFTMNITGTSQIYYVNKPGEKPVQFSNFSERVSGYEPNPANDLVFAESDIGGSEYDRFFLTDGSGAEFRQISGNEPKVLYGFGRWSPDGTFFTYYTNKRNPFYYDIYLYYPATGADELILSSDHSNFPSAVSSDGNLIVIARSYSTYDNDLYLLNRKTKELKLITEHDNFNNPAEFQGAVFDENNEKIYIVTNLNNDFFRLAVYDLKSRKLTFPEFSFLNEFKKMELQRLVLSPDKSVMMFMINDNGYDRLLMYDLKANKLIGIPEKLKTLSVTAIEFANKHKKVIIGVNSAANPSVLYEWNYENGEILQVTSPELSGIDPNTFIAPQLISYRSYDGLDIPAFIYKPLNPENKKLPCIIMIHGGPESQATYGFAPVYQYFLQEGYIIAEPNVRGSSGYGKKYASLDNIRNRENSVKDIASLVDYLMLQPDINESKIAVYGGSYGGYMVLASLTLYPELFAAGVDVVGISNFVTFLQNTSDYRKNNRASEYGSLENDREFLENISPLNKVTNIKAPLMIIHGRNDPRVPVTEAEQMYNAIINNNGTTELLIYEDEGHGVSKQKNRLDLYPKIVNFLNKWMK